MDPQRSGGDPHRVPGAADAAFSGGGKPRGFHLQPRRRIQPWRSRNLRGRLSRPQRHASVARDVRFQALEFTWSAGRAGAYVCGRGNGPLNPLESKGKARHPQTTAALPRAGGGRPCPTLESTTSKPSPTWCRSAGGPTGMQRSVRPKQQRHQGVSTDGNVRWGTARKCRMAPSLPRSVQDDGGRCSRRPSRIKAVQTVPSGRVPALPSSSHEASTRITLRAGNEGTIMGFRGGMVGEDHSTNMVALARSLHGVSAG